MNFAETSLSELATQIPMATELFRKNRLDFCCGGRVSLKEACEKKNLNLSAIVEELKKLNPKANTQFDDAPLESITRYIVERYHDDLRRRIPEIVALAEKVERVHGDRQDCPRGLALLMKNFQEEMFLHMMKEENVLFPLIDSGRGSMAMMPVKVMTAEHDSHGRQLDEMHRLTNDFNPPKDACGTWRALYSGLEKLEEELMNHIHLENNILFPKALGA